MREPFANFRGLLPQVISAINAQRAAGLGTPIEEAPPHLMAWAPPKEVLEFLEQRHALLFAPATREVEMVIEEVAKDGARFVDARVIPATEVHSVASETARFKGGRPGKYDFGEAMDELNHWERENPATKDQLAQRLAEIEVGTRCNGKPGPDYDFQSAIRSAADYLREECPLLWNAGLRGKRRENTKR